MKMYTSFLEHKRDHHGGIDQREELYLVECYYAKRNLVNKQTLFGTDQLSLNMTKQHSVNPLKHSRRFSKLK